MRRWKWKPASPLPMPVMSIPAKRSRSSSTPSHTSNTAWPRGRSALLAPTASAVTRRRSVAMSDDIATLRLLVTAEAVGANKADRPLGHAVLDVWEGVELDRDLLAGMDITGIGSGDAGFHFQRRIGRHQRNQRLARLHDRANRDLSHG